MSSLRAFIVDDEHWAIRRLEAQLHALGGVDVIGAARTGADAAKALEHVSADVVLLDIKMPGCDGFEFLKALPSGSRPEVVFVTAFEEYAPAAFEVEAADYLLKPVETERLQQALDKVRRRRHTSALVEEASDLRRVLDAVRRDRRQAATTRYEQELWIRHNGRTLRIDIAQIDWIESDRDYAMVYVQDRSYMLRRSLTQFAKTLDPEMFLRVHRSVIVRRSQIAALERRKGRACAIVLEGGKRVPVGATYAGKVSRALRQRHASS